MAAVAKSNNNMKSLRIIYHLARADFLERVRRYSFLAMLMLVVFLGYQSAIGNVTLQLGQYRGEYNSAWVGAMMSISATFFIGWFGFYLVKGSVARDKETGVGQIMATTPLTRPLYTLGKWVSNFAVLMAMAAALALAGIVIQLLQGENARIELAPFITPFIFIVMPVMALAAAFAVLFETIPFLSGGFGNIVYFFAFIFALPLGEQLSKISPALDPLGFGLLMDNMGKAALAVYPDYNGSFTLASDSQKIFGTFTWPGVDWSPGIILARFAYIGIAILLTLLAALFFDRFDPSRAKPRRMNAPRSASSSDPQPAPVSQALPAVHLTPLNAASNRFSFFNVFLAEIKLLLKGQRWWWYAVSLILIAAQLFNEPEAARVLLVLAWTWPVLILSGLGCRESRFDTRQIVFSAPRPLTRQLPAAWLSAFVVTALMGSGAFLRFLLAGEFTSLLAWTAGALFIPSLALALGVLTGSSKTFEVVYISLMYLVIQKVVPLDFVGMTPESPWYVYAPLAIFLLVFAFMARQRQLTVKNASR